MNKRAVYKFFTFPITLILCTALFIIPIHADSDYEFYFPDPDSYSGYAYFQYCGYDDLVLSTTSTENITYNVDLSADLDSQQSNSDKGSIDLQETGQEHTTGTINSNGSSTLGSKYLTCSTTVKTSGTQTYSCYFSSSSSYVSNSQSINIGFNENTYTSVNNDVSGSMDIGTVNTDGDIVGTISATEAFSSKLYSKLPWLYGTYTSPTGHDAKRAFFVDADTTSYLIFITDFYHLPQYTNYERIDADNYNISGRVENFIGGLYLYTYTFTYVSGTESTNNQLTIDIPWLGSHKVLPVFAGKEKFFTDYLRDVYGFKTKTNSLIEDGNSESQNLKDTASTKNDTLNNKISSFDNIENQQVTQMTNSLNNISVNSDLLSNNGFLNAAQWVKVQFDRMTVNTPIGSVLSFSLILGLALIFLGKIR